MGLFARVKACVAGGLFTRREVTELATPALQVMGFALAALFLLMVMYFGLLCKAVELAVLILRHGSKVRFNPTP
jgi:hypothetical protein